MVAEQFDLGGIVDQPLGAARQHCTNGDAVRVGQPLAPSERADQYEHQQRAVEAIRNAIEDDPESEVRQQAVFALSQLPKDQGIPMLTKLARTHRDPEVRKAALFWLGQSNDPRALELFEEILLN